MNKLVQLADKIQVSIHLQLNPWKDYYETFETHLENRPEFYDQEQIDKLDVSKDIWILQFYPHTPIGFYILIGNDLDALLDEALAIDLDK